MVYISSEDGRVYYIPQGHAGLFTQLQRRIFMKEALGAAYTPLSIGTDVKIYAQNDGHFFVAAAKSQSELFLL